MLRKFWKGIIIGLLLIFGQNAFAATTELGLGDTFKYSLISVGDILKVPEGATGCTIHDDSIPGTLDLDEQVGADTVGLEELANADLTNAAEWDDTDANITQNAGAGTVTWDGAGAGAFYTTDTSGMFTVGKLYEIVVEIDSMTAGNVYVIAGSGAFQGTPDYWTAVGTKTTYRICTDDLHFGLYGDATCDAVVSNISVKEVTSDTGIYNTWITTVDPAGLDATEPVLFFNCAFVESEAAIEAKDADDILYFDDECQFSIVEADCFRDYASADYHLTAGSPLKDAGEAYLNITNLDTSDFSVGVDDYSSIYLHTFTGNHDAVDDGTTSKDDCLMLAADDTNSSHYTLIAKANNGMTDQGDFKLTYSFYIPAAQTHTDGIIIKYYNATIFTTLATHAGINGAWTTNTVYWSVSETATMSLVFYMMDGASEAFIGDNDGTGDLLYLKDIEIGYDAGDVDLEGRITPIGAGYDIGAYELRVTGESMGMGMGLRGYCPHRVDN